MAQQLLGGIGFTLEFHIQVYLRGAEQQLMWVDDLTFEDAASVGLLD